MRPLVLASAALVLTALTAASCDEAPDVDTAQVSRAAVSEVVEAPASVTARAVTTVAAPTAGTLASLAVKPGQTVRKGQVLGVIDSPEARTRLSQATAALSAARRSGGGMPRADLGGVQRRLDQSATAAFTHAREAASHITDPDRKAAVLAGITESETRYATVSQAAWQAVRGVERGLASVGSAMRALSAAQTMQAQQAYDIAKSTVDALTLKAPLDGVVQLGGSAQPAGAPADLTGLLGGLAGGQLPGAAAGPPAGVSVHVAVGAPVSAGTAILTIVDTGQLGLVAEVDETDILLVNEGVQAEAELDAAPGVAFTAAVTAIDVLPTANSRGAVAYKVHLVLRDGEVSPRPGMSALVRLKVREAADAIAVPAGAVFSHEGRDVVWVREADGTAVRRPVTIGVSGSDLLQVTAGLSGGETIVVRGADKVSEGDRLP